MNRVAIIDIGSNSLKLIISDIYDNKFFQISYEKKTKLRLSNYKTRANDITALGIKKLTSSLEEMKKIENCLECGQCIKKCPYELNTPELLKKNYEDYKKVLAGEVSVN